MPKSRIRSSASPKNTRSRRRNFSPTATSSPILRRILVHAPLGHAGRNLVPPLARRSERPPEIDEARTVHHGLGFVPLVWVRNLPGPSATGDANDGACTFRAAIETQIEIDYQLSQAGRGLKYSSDPTLAHQGTRDHRQRDRQGRGQRARRQRERRCQAAGDRRHRLRRRDRVCAHLARVRPGKRPRQSRQRGPADGGAVGARARTDEPGPDLARRQSPRQLRRGRAPRTRAHDRCVPPKSIGCACSGRRLRRSIPLRGSR